MKQNKILLLVMLVILPGMVWAQNSLTNLCYNIPSDSLMFMVYMNKSYVENDSLVQEAIKEMPEEMEDIAKTFNEFCFYGQAHELYDSYRIDFRTSGTVAIDKLNNLLSELDFKVKSFTDGLVILEGGQNKCGYFINGSDFSTLKIYNQTTVVNKELRSEFEEIRSKLIKTDGYRDYELRIEYSNKLDSIGRLDSLDSKIYFDNLLLAEQKRIGKGENIQTVKSPLKMNSYTKEFVDGKSIVAYIDARYISRMPFYLYRSMDYEFYEFVEHFNQMSTAFMLYDRVWCSAQIDSEKVEIQSLSENSNGLQYSFKLDKDILKYLPVKRPESFAIYNANISEIKMHLLNNFYFHEMNNEERAYAKLALLAIDDDILRSIGNGFVAINEGEAMGRDLPDFKMAFKLPNRKKGQMLIEILCQEFDVFTKLSENTFVIRESRNSEERVNICIVDDVWIMGTASFEELKQVNAQDNLAAEYPMFSNKRMVQYAIFNQALFGSSKGPFSDIEVESSLLNKKVLKTKVTIRK